MQTKSTQEKSFLISRSEVMLRLIYSPKAESFLRGLALTDVKLYRILSAHLDKLPVTYRQAPFLKGSKFGGIRKHRVGDFRILYEIHHQELIVLVISIGHRRDVYDR